MSEDGPTTRAVLEEMRDRLIARRDDPDAQSFLGEIEQHIARLSWVLEHLPDETPEGHPPPLPL